MYCEGWINCNGLIYSENLLWQFVEEVLVDLQEDEVYIAMLAARKKYGEVSTSQEMLDTLIMKDNSPEYILRKMRKFAHVSYVYRDKKTENYIPPTAMVIYIDLSPKSTIKAYNILFNEYINELYNYTQNSDYPVENFRRINSRMFSAIARATSYKPYYIVDIDNKDEDLLQKVYDMLDIHVAWISETRGGYHLIVERNQNAGKILHTEIIDMTNVEVQSKQAMTPLPGTLQGSFPVKRIEL